MNSTDPPRRVLLRMARLLEQQYETERSKIRPPSWFSLHRWEHLQKLRSRLELAQRYQLSTAVQFTRDQLRSAVLQLSRELSTQVQELTALDLRSPIPSQRLLYEELRSLFDEFEQVEIDLQGKAIAVQTDRIILEEIDLGPFEIKLLLSEFGQFQPYEVVALEPSRPASNDDVTHPHVQSATLCEGEGKQAIARALEEGRLGELFVLIHQILQTYNPGSAYHSLSDWDSEPCQDCGDLVHGDDRYECERCQCRLCDRCTSCCNCCGDPICTECRTRCNGCECENCDHCYSRCAACNDSRCTDCLIEDLCPTCHQTSLENQDEEETSSSDQTTSTATPSKADSPQTDDSVQPHRLGQFTVSA